KERDEYTLRAGGVLIEEHPDHAASPERAEHLPYGLALDDQLRAAATTEPGGQGLEGRGIQGADHDGQRKAGESHAPRPAAPSCRQLLAPSTRTREIMMSVGRRKERQASTRFMPTC